MWVLAVSVRFATVAACRKLEVRMNATPGILTIMVRVEVKKGRDHLDADHRSQK